MRTILISLALSLLTVSSLIANNSKDIETDFSRKSLLSTSVRNTGIEIINTEETLTSNLGYITIADYVNYSSVSPSKEVNITRSVYTYLRAVSVDVVEGNTYVYSDIKEVFQPIVLEHNSQVIVQREELIAGFQQQLLEKFPNQSFEVSIESIQGLYTTYQEAANAQNDCKNSKNTVVELK